MIITRETTLEKHNLDTLKNPVFNDFFYWFKEKYNCKYMTYLLEDLETNSVFFISTNGIWMEELTNHKIINECPIYKLAKSLYSLGLAPIIWNHLRGCLQSSPFFRFLQTRSSLMESKLPFISL